MTADTPEYFQLRPEVEKAYGYTHAVKIGGTRRNPAFRMGADRLTRASFERFRAIGL